MFFENHDVDARSCQKIAGHHTGRASADDAAAGAQALNRLWGVLHFCIPISSSSRYDLVLESSCSHDQKDGADDEKRQAVWPQMTNPRAAQTHPAGNTPE